MAHLTAVASGKSPLCTGKRATLLKSYTFFLVKEKLLSLSPTLLKQWPQRLRGCSPQAAGLATTDVGKRYYAQGVVKVQEVPSSRLVRVRRRDNGAELVSGMSGAGGFFNLSWSDYAGVVEVTIYDDAQSPAPYNAKVFDLITG